MDRIESRLNTNSDEFRRNREAMDVAGQAAARRNRARSPGRPGVRARAARRTRQVARARSRQKTARPRQSVPRTVAAGRVQYVRRRLAVREHHHRYRQNPRARGGDSRQRRDRQRRHVFSDDREEASARAADRDRESSAVRLPGRFGRRVPADAIRDFSRRASLRAHLLQPGADVREGYRAGRGGDGQLHGGRRVRACDVRRKHHSSRGGNDLPGGTAAGARCDRRRSHGRGAGRRRRAYAAVGRERSPGRRRRACASDRAHDLRKSRASRGSRDRAGRARGSALRSGRAVRHHPGRHAQAVRRARSDRAAGRRQPDA